MHSITILVWCSMEMNTFLMPYWQLCLLSFSSQFQHLFWFFIHFPSFRSFCLTFQCNGIFFTPLLILFKVVTKMEQSLEHVTVVGLLSLVSLSGSQCFLRTLLHWHRSTLCMPSCVLLSVIAVHINIEPFKSTAVSWYTSVDPIFLILICVFYTSVVGSSIGSLLDHRYISVMVVLGLLTVFVAIVCIVFLMLHWTYSQKRWGVSVL